jgi:hypothetical protein
MQLGARRLAGHVVHQRALPLVDRRMLAATAKATATGVVGAQDVAGDFAREGKGRAAGSCQWQDWAAQAAHHGKPRAATPEGSAHPLPYHEPVGWVRGMTFSLQGNRVAVTGGCGFIGPDISSTR